MKSSKSIILCATGLTLLFSSCKKEEWLNPQPKTLITDVTAFSTPERILSQVNGLYASMKTTSYLGSWYTIISDVRTGEFHCSNMNAATGSTMYSMLPQTTTTDVNDIWVALYASINKINVFLDNMDNGGDAVLDAAVANNYRAEARLIRGMTYYYLLQFYARPYWDGNGSKPGLPLRLTGNTGPGNYDLARSSVADTYKQVLADLDFAEQNLPSNYSSAFLNTTRAHKNSAIALKTRVYLSMRDYAKVVTEANKLVPATAPFIASSGVGNKLEANFADIFKSPYSSNESIFSMPFTNNDAPGSALSRYYLPGTGDGGTATSNGAGEYSLNKVEGIYSSPLWVDSDARKSLTKIGTKTGKAWLTKFNQASPYIDYAPVIRYSEVLLNLSEALARTTNTVDARSLAFLNAVYGRSNQGSSLSASSFANVNAYLNRIIEERRIEFVGEGIRNGDIMRLGLTIPAKSQHAIAAVPTDDPAYILPIPSNELILNNLMENN
ncbi:RagB/SusD family nutrient uptake outer membrane protein [Sphingobacterium endophyticum]|uniref:RagB/SusD family nutrient uptake outer membrane protein n=1 Tax=Sphingobacterium endophyticum TaxID=2546448 RepID=UPI0012E1681B|nr:RagB/SusD family nutrient uptake outer membrane protein [Sphingobacterium endophyticum]